MLRRAARRYSVLKNEAFVKMLEKEGFTREQSEGLVQLVDEAIKESMQSASRSMVPKSEQQEAIVEMNTNLKQLKDDVDQLEKKDFQLLKSELERIIENTNKIKSSMRDEINRIHVGVRLDQNLEKGRIADESAELKNILTNTEKKIEKDIAMLKQKIDKIRNQTKKRLRNVAVGIILSFIGYKTVLISGLL